MLAFQLHAELRCFFGVYPRCVTDGSSSKEGARVKGSKCNHKKQIDTVHSTETLP